MEKVKSFICILILTLVTSCKSYEIVHESEMRTNDMRREDLRSKVGPFALKIIFDDSLQNDRVKVEGFTPENILDWITIFDDTLDDCDEPSCKVIVVNTTVAFYVYINNKKFEFMNTDDHKLAAYRYLIVSKEKKHYSLVFSNYLKEK